MNETESTNHVTEALWTKIDYLSKEYDVSVARMIGILLTIILGLWDDCKDREESE